MAVARIWSGATEARDGAEYLEYLKETGLAEYRRTPGNLDVLALTRDEEDRAEFLVVSVWTSVEAIGAFAGTEPERAVFYPEDERYLVRAAPTATHYRLAFRSPAAEEGGRAPGGLPGGLGDALVRLLWRLGRSGVGGMLPIDGWLIG